MMMSPIGLQPEHKTPISLSANNNAAHVNSQAWCHENKGTVCVAQTRSTGSYICSSCSDVQAAGLSFYGLQSASQISHNNRPLIYWSIDLLIYVTHSLHTGYQTWIKPAGLEVTAVALLTIISCNSVQCIKVKQTARWPTLQWQATQDR